MFRGGCSDGFRGVPGGLRGGAGGACAGARMAPESLGRCWAAHESFGLKFSYDFGALVNLSLRFHMILGPRTLSLHACAAKSSRGE